MVMLPMTLGDPLTILNYLSFYMFVALCILLIGDRKDYELDVKVECRGLRTTNRR